MAANQKAEENAEEQAQQEPMPSSEEKGQEVADSQQAADESQETVEAPAGDSDGELPKGVSDRTREQFEKLQTQLKETRERLFRQQSSDVPEDGEIKPLVDKSTGLVDIVALNEVQQKAYDAEKRARNLEQRIQQQAQDGQVRELQSAYPELKNPKTKEAKDFFDESERVWMHSQAYPEKYGGESLSQKQAADFAKERMGNKPETAKQEAQRMEPKEQASLGASGQPTQGVQSKVASEEENQRLQLGTRFGDKDSMITRMRAIREAEAK